MISAVKARNFLSWEEMDRPIEPGVTLIDGWNEDDQTSEGSGKSAILNAICWGLYGKIPKDANIDDVIKEGEKHCEVQVHFDDGVVVRRTRGPNELSMIRGDQLIKGKDAKETQGLIEEYLGLTFETFCQTIYFAQNYAKKFITANQEEKGKILSEVQDLIIFDKAQKEVKSIIKAEEDAAQKLKHQRDLAVKDEELTKRDIQAEELKYQHALQQQAQRIQNIEAQITNVEIQRKNALDQQVQRIKNIEAQIVNVETQRKNQVDQQTLRINNLNGQIIEAEKMAQSHEASKAQLLEAVSTLVYDEAREKQFVEANNQLIAEAAVVNSEIANIDRLVAQRTTAENQGKRYAARYKQIQADKQKNLDFIANPTKNCPTCGTQLEACDTAHAQAEVDKLNQEEAEIIKALTDLDAEISVPIPTKDELNQRLNELRQARVSNDAEIQNIRSVKDQMNRAAAHLTSFDQNIKAQRDRAEKLQAQVAVESQPLSFDDTQLNALNSSLAAERLPIQFDDTQLNGLKASLEAEKLPIQFDAGPAEALKAKLESLKSNIEDIDRLAKEKQKHLGRLEDLKDGFKEIKSYVFNSMLNEINARVQKYLGHLFEMPVSVRFKNDEMKIETEVKFDGVDRGLGLLSGGQFRRVSLAVDLALSDVITARKGSRVGVLILDEYFKDLSETSMEKCLALLEGRGQPVLLIEHNSVFKNIVNNSVMVRLENGTSRVEIQNN